QRYSRPVSEEPLKPKRPVLRHMYFTFVQAFKYELWAAVKSLARQPWFTGAAVLTLAVGIGASAAVFSVVYSTLIQPLPYGHPERLVMISENGDDISHRMISYLNFVDWRRRNQVFEDISTVRDLDVTLTEGDQAEAVTAKTVAADYFKILGVTPKLG